MGIKSLTQIIKRECPNGIKHDSLSNLSGKKVAVDASLIIYQNLLNIGNRPLFKNSNGKITKGPSYKGPKELGMFINGRI